MRVALALVLIGIVTGCSQVPDRFQSVSSAGTYQIENWTFSTRPLKVSTYIYDVLVVVEDSPFHISDDEVELKSRYIDAARRGIGDRCDNPNTELVERIWDEGGIKSLAMIVRFRCS